MEEESKETKKQEKSMLDTVKEENDKAIQSIIEQGIQPDNIEYLYKMIDIKKDILKIEKEEKAMKYRGYGEGSMGGYGEGSMGGYGAYSEGGSYGRRGVPGSGRGRYNEGGSYGRRGVKGTGRGRYRGEEMMDEMQFHYGNYSESGQYGAEGETMEALSNLMESAYEYFKDLKENANSQEEVKMMEHYFKKMGQM